MKCITCQGKMKKGTAPLHVDRKGCHVAVDAMPAWVCSQCGEAYFEPDEVDAIQKALRVLAKRATPAEART